MGAMRPVSETKWIRCQIGADVLVFAARPELRERHKSIVVLIHDAAGSVEDLAPWFGQLEPEAELVLGRRERAARLREAGWSNKAIADELQVHPSTVGRWFTPPVEEPEITTEMETTS